MSKNKKARKRKKILSKAHTLASAFKGSIKTYEDYAILLDVSEDQRIAQAIGDTRFNLLKLELKIPNDANLRIGKRIYVGKDKEQRNLVKYVTGRLNSLLTNDAKRMAEGKTQEMVIRALDSPDACILKENLLLFFNLASPSSLRKVGLNRRFVNILIEERDRKIKQQGRRFENFAEIERVMHSAGIRLPRYELSCKIAERINDELNSRRELFILKFLRNPVKSISNSHARI